MRLFRSALIAILLFAALTARAAPRAGDIIRKIDFMMEQIGDISVKASMVQNKVRQGVKSYESLYFRRDKTDEFLIVILAPDTEKGNGYLRVGENFWMYRQNTRTFQHISRDESIMGTDAKGGDFEKRKLVELYRPQTEEGGVTEEMLGKKAVYRFTIIAKVNDVTYPKQVYWVQRDNFLPLKIESYSLSGTLMQTAYYPKWTVVDGKYIPIQMIFIDEFEKGNKTIVELSGISTEKLDPKIFTKAYLENLSR
ncbi:MAG TPA: outer membrane lipoprotein-sorting protein [Spirochaetota bacterium]|nr:outer membrane lipoprotein-sorting protein [Spirochaetota bacterium]HOD14924.1 outer membrane lipoprotein-sorting protein [Spirochaetota bacterium]HPG52041.1 outer membrane lipoprotein-sorting protein [Spirochaetota bacterium]HPN12309.1 outer membrane lipoprotein-sorting protein [Spirochaetota bacterium]